MITFRPFWIWFFEIICTGSPEGVEQVTVIDFNRELVPKRFSLWIHKATLSSFYHDQQVCNNHGILSKEVQSICKFGLMVYFLINYMYFQGSRENCKGSILGFSKNSLLHFTASFFATWYWDSWYVNCKVLSLVKSTVYSNWDIWRFFSPSVDVFILSSRSICWFF